jgi:predicted membrane metal-binding protein
MQPGLDLLSTPEGELASRLAIDLAFVLVLIRVIYYRTYHRTDLFLTFFSFNLVIFLIAFVLNSTEMSMGAAFGLFAVFSMLRYRTEGISATDMTYLFLGIALGLMLAVSSAGPLGLALIGGILLLSTFLLESGWLAKREVRQEVQYDNIELVNAHSREELLRDLRQRTGLNVLRVEVQELDLVKDSAKLIVYYHASDAAAPQAALPLR